MSAPFRSAAPVRLGASVRFRIHQRPDGECVVVDARTGQTWITESLDRARQIQAQLERSVR
jgi:hypothetical protein